MEKIHIVKDKAGRPKILTPSLLTEVKQVNYLCLQAESIGLNKLKYSDREVNDAWKAARIAKADFMVKLESCKDYEK